MQDHESLSKYLETTITVGSSVIDYLRENQDDLHKTDDKHKLCNFRIMFYKNIINLAKSFKVLSSSEEKSFSILALGSLTRAVFEAYRPFYYLTIDNVDKNYQNFRMLIFQAYGYIENANLIKSINGDISKTEIESNLKNIKKQIRKNIFFKTLTDESDIPEKPVYTSFTGHDKDNEEFSDRLKLKIVSADGCFKDLKKIISERVKMLNLEIINDVEVKDLEIRFDKFFYKLFSNYVHSSAFAIALIQHDDFELIKQESDIMISSVIFCLCLAIEDISNLYPSIEEITNSSEFQESLLEGSLLFLGNLLGRHKVNK